MLLETLRVEMAPLGVRFLTVVTGSVATNIRANVVVTTLPKDSYYELLEDETLIKATGQYGIVRGEAQEYAENVVRDILARATGRTFRGKNSSMVRYGFVLLPMWYIARFFTNEWSNKH